MFEGVSVKRRRLPRRFIIPSAASTALPLQPALAFQVVDKEIGCSLRLVGRRGRGGRPSPLEESINRGPRGNSPAPPRIKGAGGVSFQHYQLLPPPGSSALGPHSAPMAALSPRQPSLVTGNDTSIPGRAD